MTEHVTLSFKGLMLEKLIQRALEEGARFEQVSRRGRRAAVLVTDDPGARILTKLARQYALDVREISRTGPGRTARSIRRRWTLPASLVLCGLLSCLFLSRLWIIDVHMLDGSPMEDEIRQALENMGVRPGMPMGKIDPKALPSHLQARVEGLSYAGARTQGVRLLIEAAREDPAPDLYDPKAARDLVAARDALLVSLDVMAGTAAVKPGQVVQKGQVLIRGEERDERETTRGVCALGAAVGRVWLTGQAEAPVSRRVNRDTGRISVERNLVFLDFSAPLVRGQSFPLERTYVRRLPLVGLLLPLHIEEITHIQQSPVREKADLSALKAEIGKIAMKEALSSLPNGIQPVDKWVDYSMIEGGIVRARAVAEIRLNIAVARDALNP